MVFSTAVPDWENQLRKQVRVLGRKKRANERLLPFRLVKPALALQCPLPRPGFTLPTPHTHTHTQNYWIPYKGAWCIREEHKRQVSDKTSQHLKCKVTWPASFWSGRGSHRAIETTLVQIATIQGWYLKNGALVNVTFHCNSSRTHINSLPTKQLGRLKGTYQGSI